VRWTFFRPLQINIIINGIVFASSSAKGRMQAFSKGEYSGKVLKSSGDEGITASVTTYFQKSFNDAKHFHHNTHISFVLHGGCLEKKKDRYERLPGRLTCYYAGEPHQVMNVAGESRHINIEIEPSFFRDHQMAESSLFAALSKNPDAKLLMLDMYREIMTADEYSNHSIQLLLMDLVHKADKLSVAGTIPSWVHIVKEVLHDHADENISLQALSNKANVHPVTISKYFPKYFSCTLGQYMRKLKIERSLSLIKSPESSLTAVAYECGFADQSHFTRTFKKLTGFLPTSYQKL
jgi:AraC family transcriptional regulator